VELRAIAGLLALGLLIGCGSNGSVEDFKRTASGVSGLLRRPPPMDVAAERATVEAAGTRVIAVVIDKRFGSYMQPYVADRDGKVTWAAQTLETVVTRDGIVLETHGFAQDLMASRAPTAAQVASAQGSFHRIYENLDGRDSATQRDYDCDFAPGSAEKVVILGLAYPTRQVVETCFKGEERFQNRYWIDQSGKIRQSEQVLTPGRPPMKIQHIID
jgi:hypothetical protein